jgi:hypothetical protein
LVVVAFFPENLPEYKSIVLVSTEILVKDVLGFSLNVVGERTVEKSSPSFSSK